MIYWICGLDLCSTSAPHETMDKQHILMYRPRVKFHIIFCYDSYMGDIAGCVGLS